MKTGTVAILASCLLGQALAAPVAGKAQEVAVKVNRETKGIKVDDLKAAIMDLAKESRSVQLGSPSKRGDDIPKKALGSASPFKRGNDILKQVLDLFGLDSIDLDRDTLAKAQDKINTITDSSASPVSRFSELGGLLSALEPYLDKADKAGKTTGSSPSKRNNKEVDDMLKKLGVDPKKLDKDSLKKIEDKVKEITDKTVAPIVRAGGLGDILSILKPLLGGSNEEKGAAVDPAKGATKGPLDGVTKDLPLGGGASGAAGSVAGNVPTKRLVDESILDGLLDTLGLETGDGADKKKPDLADTADNLADGALDKATGALGDATKNLPTGALPTKRDMGLEQVMELLKALGLDEPLKSLPGIGKGLTSGDASSDAASSAGGLMEKRQLDAVTDLLDGLLGGDKGDSGSGNPVAGALDTAGSALNGPTGGATKGLTDTVKGAAGSATGLMEKRQLDAVTDLLNGLLGGDKGGSGSGNPVAGALGSAGSTLDGLTGGATKGLTDTVKGAAGSAGGLMEKRQLDTITDLLNGLLGGDKGGSGSGNPVAGALGSAGSTLDGLTGGATKGLTDTVKGAAGSAGGLMEKRQLDTITDLLNGLLGGDKGGSGSGNPVAGALGSAGSTLDGLTGGATKGLTDTVKGAAGSAGGLMEKRQLDTITDLLNGLLGGDKGGSGSGNPVAGALGSAGSTLDGLTGGATKGLTDTVKGAAGSAGGLLGKRQLGGQDASGASPGKPTLDLASLLQALGPVLGQLQGGADASKSGAPKPKASSPPVGLPTPPAIPIPKMKRDGIPPAAPAPPAPPAPGAEAGPVPPPADVTPIPLPSPMSTEPLTVIYDDLTEVTSLLGEIQGEVPADQANNLRQTIDSFLSSISDLMSPKMVPDEAAPKDSPTKENNDERPEELFP